MTSAEIAAVLTGLRVSQSEIEEHGEPLGKYMGVFTNGGEVVPLTSEQIDALCEKINCTPQETWRA